MEYFGLLGFVFALMAFSEIASLKKRIAALEAREAKGAAE